MQPSVHVKLSADLLGDPARRPPGEVTDEQVIVEGQRHDETPWRYRDWRPGSSLTISATERS
jgi:hypothetical protein